MCIRDRLQDLLIRFYRMNGYETLWQPGTDHAGIATQAVVEKKLSEKGIKKNKIGREAFIKEVWKWKDYSEEKITSQIKRLGCTVEWDKYRFTFDDDFCEAVNKAFVELYRNNKNCYTLWMGLRQSSIYLGRITWIYVWEKRHTKNV